MKGFKDFAADQRATEMGNPAVLWYETGDAVAERVSLGVIEEGQTYQLDSRYSARFDIGYQPNQRNHTHVYLKDTEFLVVNDDGTPSHGSPPFSSLPKKIQSKIRALKLVEASSYLTETASGNAAPPIISKAVMLQFWMRLLLQ